MILTQNQIDAEARSKWGLNITRIQKQLMKDSLADFERFIDGAFSLFPELLPYKNFKSIEIRQPEQCGSTCKHLEDVTIKAYSPQQISGLERSFRNMFGDTKANDLLDMAARWQFNCFEDDSVGRLGYWANSLWKILDDTFKSSAREAQTIWDRLSKRRQEIIPVPNPPLVVTDGEPWIQRIYKDGYKNVTSKITKLHLPQIQEIMVNGQRAGLSPQEIAAQLNELGGANSYHWTRLVRSESINASQEAKIEQAAQDEEMNVQWITSRMGATCPICLERDRKIFNPREMGVASYFTTDVTNEIDANRTVKIGRYPHPQCRCSMAYTYKDVTWKG